MPTSNPFLWPRPPAIVSCGIAVLSVAIALIIGQWPPLHLQAAPVSLFLCAVMFSAWFGGARPGLLAISLSVLEGMGLGLSISRTIIEAHGGRLWATANEGRGATIRFTLPAGGDRS